MHEDFTFFLFVLYSCHMVMRYKSAAQSSAEWSLGGKGRRASVLLSSRLKTWTWSGPRTKRRVRIVQPGVSHRLQLVTPELLIVRIVSSET